MLPRTGSSWQPQHLSLATPAWLSQTPLSPPPAPPAPPAPSFCSPPDRYSRAPRCYDAAYAAVKQAFCEAFYGPPRQGVFSPSVQYTLYRMGQGAIAR